MRLKKNSGNFEGVVDLPGSKSISNRVLMMYAIAEKKLDIQGLSVSDDTSRMLRNLNYVKVCGQSGIPLVIDSGNAGTVMRFLTALLACYPQNWLLTGSPRMKIRPIDGLVDALRQLGARIDYAEIEGYPPLLIHGCDFAGGEVAVDASKSSQFISALMMIAPYLDGGLVIHLKQQPVSFSYIEMTARLMRQMQVTVSYTEQQITVEEGEYKMDGFRVEPDWSAAAYWYQLVALSDKADVFLPGLKSDSLQGDRILADIYSNLGVQSLFEEEGLRLKSSQSFSNHFHYDFRNCPDIALSVIVSCAARKIEASFTGMTHLKYKESDRMRCLQNELLQTGVELKEEGAAYTLSYKNDNVLPSALRFNTYDDHRMAMSLAPLVMQYKELEIERAEVVNKSYPGFWEDLRRLKIIEA